MKREQREQMKSEIEDFQKRLIDNHDENHYREMDAGNIKQQIAMKLM